jgi:hypothetical protein
MQQKFSSENVVLTLSGGGRIEAAKSEARMCTPKSQVAARRGRGHRQWSSTGTSVETKKLKKAEREMKPLRSSGTLLMDPMPCSWIGRSYWTKLLRAPIHTNARFRAEAGSDQIYGQTKRKNQNSTLKMQKSRKIKTSHSKCKNQFFH